MGRVMARRGTAATAKAEAKRRTPGDAGEAPPLRKSEATRLRILDAAARVFAQRGYADTRLSDIAQEAGTFAGSAMGLNAFLTAVLVPIAVEFLR